MSAALYILCGGQSRRFGSDKGLFSWKGKSLVQRAAEQFPTLLCGQRVFLVSSALPYRELPMPVIEDARPGRPGPLAGLEAAAAHARGKFPLFFVTSCDRFGLEEHWLDDLAAALERSGALAAAFFQTYWQPFPSAFQTEAGAWASRLLDRGETRPAVLLDRLALRLPAPPGWEKVRDINRPDQLEEIP